MSGAPYLNQLGQDDNGNLKGHTHPPAFGKKVEGCTRCEDLRKGAPARRLNGGNRRQAEAQHLRDIEAHFNSTKHRSGGCGHAAESDAQPHGRSGNDHGLHRSSQSR